MGRRNIEDRKDLKYSRPMFLRSGFIILYCFVLGACGLSTEEIAQDLEQRYSYRCVTQGYVVDTKEHTDCMISMIQSNYDKRVMYKTTVEPLVDKNEDILD